MICFRHVLHVAFPLSIGNPFASVSSLKKSHIALEQFSFFTSILLSLVMPTLIALDVVETVSVGQVSGISVWVEQTSHLKDSGCNMGPTAIPQNSSY